MKTTVARSRVTWTLFSADNGTCTIPLIGNYHEQIPSVKLSKLASKEPYFERAGIEFLQPNPQLIIGLVRSLFHK